MKLLSNDEKIYRIVIFGINNSLREKIEHWLGNNTILVAYSDWGSIFKNCKLFGYKPLWNLEELYQNKDLYDYIILCETDYDKWITKSERLIEAGIDSDKILPTTMLRFPAERVFSSTLEDFIECDQKFYGLCLGMSYSRSAFLEHLLGDDAKYWFKLSMNGSDLQTHDSWLTYLFINHREKLGTVKSICLDLPYYAFDWEIQSSNQIYHRMVQFDMLNDYATFLVKRNNATEYITKYRLLKSMLRNKFECNNGIMSNYVFNNDNITKLYKDKEASFFEADKIWKIDHDASKEKNIAHLVHIKKMCEIFGIKLNICIFPMSPMFIKYNKETFYNRRDRFYSILDSLSLGINVIDLNECSEKFMDDEFRNLTHLNSAGALHCTRYIRKNIL